MIVLCGPSINYREGIVTNKPAKETKGSYVNIGLLNDCLVDKVLNSGLRVTVKMDPGQGNLSDKDLLTVSPCMLFPLRRQLADFISS